MVYNSERWKSEKERGTPSKSYREFTNESGNLWKELSNHEKSLYDARANHQQHHLGGVRIYWHAVHGLPSLLVVSELKLEYLPVCWRSTDKLVDVQPFAPPPPAGR